MPGIRRRRARPGERGLRSDRRATVACSSCPCSDRTSTTARRLPRLCPPGAARAAAGLLDDRAAGRRPARAAICAGSPAVTAALPAELGVRFVAVHRGLYAQSRLVRLPARQRRGQAAGRLALLARDGAISSWRRAATSRRRSRTWARAPGGPLHRRLTGRVRSAHVSTREIDYLEAILNANVYDVAIETPLQEAPLLSERLGNRLLAEARGSPARLLVQAPRRVQQDVAPAGGGAPARGRRRLSRQPRPGRRARGAATRDRRRRS